jgi:hypothetical protein
MLTRCRHSRCNGAALQLAGELHERGTGQPRLLVSGRAADIAVVPADAYEYRHLRILAQP